MYLNHYGLKQYPFNSTPDTHFFLDYSEFKDALDVLDWALVSGQGFIKITGEAGTGKTLLCRQLQSSLDDRFVVVHIPNPSMNPLALHKALATELGIRFRPNMGVPGLVKKINEKLLSLQDTGKEVVLLVDEAQVLPNDSMESIRLLSNLETENKKLLQIVLFGLTGLDDRLQTKDLQPVLQRIVFSHRLNPIPIDALNVYVHHRLYLAGYRGNPLFCARALTALHQGSRGVPGLINTLAHKALLVAYGRGESSISTYAVERAITDTECAQQRRAPAISLIRSLFSSNNVNSPGPQRRASYS